MTRAEMDDDNWMARTLEREPEPEEDEADDWAEYLRHERGRRP